MHIFLAIAGILFLIWDLARKSVLKLVLASSFLFCAIVAFKFPQKYVFLPVAFIVFAFVFYLLIKRILYIEQCDILKNNNLKDFKGKIATVKKDIGKTLSIDGIGLIDFDNQIWQAKSVDDKEIKKGQTVEIVSKENMIMNVRLSGKANCADK